METVKITAFRLNKDNPRLIRDGKFRSLVESIKRDPEFLEKRGIVHADGVILGGNQRYMAIKEALKDDAFRSSIGLEKGFIPASWVQDASDWPEEKRRRFVIVDNGSWGEWDFDLLANGFDDLQLADFGVDIPKDWKEPETPAGDDGESKIDKVSRQCLWQRNHPNKSKAQDLCKKNPEKVIVLYECSCEADSKKHNHHFDYSRIFEVVRLCERCHIIEHNRLRKLEKEADSPSEG